MSRKVVSAAAAALAAVVSAACGTGTVTPAAPTTTAPAQSTSAASPSPTQQQQAHVGDQFTVSLSDGTKYEVMLLRVDQEAQPASEFDTAPSGQHLAAAQFRVSAITGVDENANNNASATGSDEQAYTPYIVASVAEGTNFVNGQIRLQPGSRLAGWVTFKLPDGVRITKVQWIPASGFGSQAAEWLVTSSAGTSPARTPDAAETVRAYFAAISSRDYAQAWKLGGQHTGSSYASFVSGLSTTAKDTVTILSVSGNVVTARLTAEQTDGTIKIFQGTYTVRSGVIVGFNVRQVA